MIRKFRATDTESHLAPVWSPGEGWMIVIVIHTDMVIDFYVGSRVILCDDLGMSSRSKIHV
jgi:hypothetical protein